ncbi:O-antigen ligase family protein, partial [Thiomicrorhabdus sp. ZW0627]|uniref:O-antigen ligase family protein n=1 Tax=Thiomicrorhabdus sp. ZW0627 TaxID=3039774 RepID=UPI002437044C
MIKEFETMREDWKVWFCRENWASITFVLMTFFAVIPLYFENMASLGGPVFLISALVLLFNYKKNAGGQFSKWDKKWLLVAVFYAVVFIASFLLTPPYMNDGIWRNESSVFILLISLWYFLGVHFRQKAHMLKIVALSSIFCAIAFFLIEIAPILETGFWASFQGYRYGLASDGGRGLAALGFIVPITTVMLAILWVQNRSWMYLVLLICSFLLSGLTGARTALSLLLIPMLLLFIHVLFVNSAVSKRVKKYVAISLLSLGVTVGFLAKGKVVETFSDFSHIEQGYYETSLGLRYAMFDIGVTVVKEHFWFGVGPNHYKENVTQVVNASSYSDAVKLYISNVTQIHNQYLMSLMLSGVIGLISLMLFLVYPLTLFYKKYREKPGNEALLAIGMMFGV